MRCQILFLYFFSWVNRKLISEARISPRICTGKRILSGLLSRKIQLSFRPKNNKTVCVGTWELKEQYHNFLPRIFAHQLFPSLMVSDIKVNFLTLVKSLKFQKRQHPGKNTKNQFKTSLLNDRLECSKRKAYEMDFLKGFKLKEHADTYVVKFFWMLCHHLCMEQ